MSVKVVVDYRNARGNQMDSAATYNLPWQVRIETPAGDTVWRRGVKNEGSSDRFEEARSAADAVAEQMNAKETT
jgi:hypothetical protein